ncbi:hypothetical protein SAMN04515675_0681 [Pseudomonas costantinii]|uniref:Uncharacterized protein n=1 Tax=Pseudomonas costantinii TaxID=168469 RepID=A0A1H4ZQG5_9PSED|nr:hypothetical protein SAMN04515675_0681 [Pseudomonas costantinii]
MDTPAALIDTTKMQRNYNALLENGDTQVWERLRGW